jgi:hypothetical protein
MAKMTDWNGKGRLVDGCGDGEGRGMNGGERGGKGVVKYGGNGSD